MTEETTGPIEDLQTEPIPPGRKEGTDILSETEIPERSFKEMLEGAGEHSVDNVDVLTTPGRKKRSRGIGG